MEINRISLLEVDSTNNYASNLLKSERLPHGSVITAQFQTQGRGQRDNVWFSEADQNLMASWVFHFSHLKVSQGFAYNQAVALSLRQTIAQFLHHDVLIKWPNDIVVQNKKVAGVLIENVVQGDAIKTSICGIGVNVFQQQFELSHASSMALMGAKLNHVDQLLLALHENLMTQLNHIQSNANSISRAYQQHLYQAGQFVEFYHNHDQRSGRINGVDEWGRLIIEIDNGVIQHFHAGEIRWIWA